MKNHKKSQSILEYAVLFAVVLSALLIMQVYIKRAYQGRIKQDADSLGGAQYSPGHTIGQTVTTSTTHSVTYTGDKVDADDFDPEDLDLITADGYAIPQGVTATFSQTTTGYSRTEGIDGYAREKP